MADEEEDPTVSDRLCPHPLFSSLPPAGAVAEAEVGVGSAFLRDLGRESRGLDAVPSLSLPFTF